MKRRDETEQVNTVTPICPAKSGWFARTGILFLTLILAWPAFSSDTPVANEILLLRSGRAAIYSRTSEAFEQRLQQLCEDRNDCPRVRSTDLASFRTAAAENPRLIVSLGHEASLRASQETRNIPQLHVLVSETQHRLHEGSGHGISAIYLEQPLARQLDFIRFLLPDYRRIGILREEDPTKSLPALHKLTQDKGLELEIIGIDSPQEIGKQLHSHSRAIDVLLALPDPVIYNRDTLAGILLTAYRNRIPVIGFSGNMVRAGAIGGIFSSPASIGTEAAQVALRILDEQTPSKSAPRLLEVRINRRVAGALNIHLPTDSEIQRWKEAQ